MKDRVVPTIAVLVLFFCIAAKDACADTPLIWTSFTSDTSVANAFSIFYKPVAVPAIQSVDVPVTANLTGPILKLAKFDQDPTPTATPQCYPAGSLDISFNGSGQILFPIGDSNDIARSIALQPDGKMVVAGFSEYGTNAYDFSVLRLNASGSLDYSFGYNGKVTTAVVPGNGNDYGRSVAIQPDGKIVVAGSSDNGGSPDFAVVRYNANGDLDTTFGGNGKVLTGIGATRDEGNAVAVQPDGRILVAGYTDVGSLQSAFALVRYNANGTMDTTFGGGGKVVTEFGSTVGSIAYALALQPDGRIVAAGIDGSDVALARYNSDGSLDPTFGSNGKIVTSISDGTDRAYAMALQPDGKIILAGSAIPSGSDFALVRYNADGSLDTTFGGTGKIITSVGTSRDEAFSVAIQPDGKIIAAGLSVVGSPARESYAVVRYNSDGSLDPNFGSSGISVTPLNSNNNSARSIVIQPDGKILAAGGAKIGPSYWFSVGRYNAENYCPVLPTVVSIRRTTPVSVVDWRTVVGFSVVFNTPVTGVDRYDFAFTRTGSAAAGIQYISGSGSTYTVTVQTGDGPGTFRLDLIDNDSIMDSSGLTLGGPGAGNGNFTDGEVYTMNSMPPVTPTPTATPTATPTITPSPTATPIPMAPTTIGTSPAGLPYSVDGVTYTATNDFRWDVGTTHTISTTSPQSINNDAQYAWDNWSDGGAQTHTITAVGFATYTANFKTQYRLTMGGEDHRYGLFVFPPSGFYDAGQVIRISATAQNGDFTFLAWFGNAYAGPFPRADIVMNGPVNQYAYFQFGVAGPRTAYDYSGDRKADISVYRPAEGIWYTSNSQGGERAVQFGIATDKISPADFDGDGKTDLAVYRPSEGTWYVLYSSTQSVAIMNFGISEDRPVAADYDGDGRSDVAIFRPSTGTWWIKTGVGTYISQYGATGDIPCPADYDGDGKSDLVVYRPTNGVWYERRSTQGDFAVQFGVATDKVAPADYDGDGKMDVGVYRPSQGAWYSINSSNSLVSVAAFGLADDIPVPGDYDGDGRADIAVWRPSNGQWWLNRSTSGLTVVQFGLNGDKPTESAFGN